MYDCLERDLLGGKNYNAGGEGRTLVQTGLDASDRELAILPLAIAG
jgi:hypothetical protein